jgi:hypothetical protein
MSLISKINEFVFHSEMLRAQVDVLQLGISANKSTTLLAVGFNALAHFDRVQVEVIRT